MSKSRLWLLVYITLQLVGCFLWLIYSIKVVFDTGGTIGAFWHFIGLFFGWFLSEIIGKLIFKEKW